MVILLTSSQIEYPIIENNMAKKQMTYADMAKKIKAKYSRADYDKMEHDEMIAELRKLRDEQEEDRAVMGIAEHADNMDKEDQFDGLNNSQYLPNTFKTKPLAYDIQKDNVYGDGIGLNNNINATSNNSMPVDNPYSGVNAPVNVNNSAWQPMDNPSLYANANRSLSSTTTNKWQLPKTSILPMAISAGSSIIGDILQMRNINKNMPKSVTLPRMNAERISLEPQRQGLQRSYNTVGNVMMRNARDVSSPGSAYANQIAGLTGLTDSLGTQMGTSYMNEANTNAQMRQDASMRNQQVGVQEALQNVQLQQQNAGMKGDIINSLSQTIPMALRDYGQQASQTNMLSTMGKDYGLYNRINPNETFRQRLERLMNMAPSEVVNRNNPYIRQ